VIINYQRYRRTDRRTDRRHAISRPRICTKVHCAVKIKCVSHVRNNYGWTRYELHCRQCRCFLNNCWQPAADIRSAVRSEKGLPIIINLLDPSHVTLDVIARTAAICLRNLVVDPKNKELIGNAVSSSYTVSTYVIGGSIIGLCLVLWNPAFWNIIFHTSAQCILFNGSHNF